MVSGANTRPSMPAQTDKTATDDGRAAFETWARSIGIAARRMEVPDAQHYSDAMSEGMWYAWIAGRAALAAAPQPAAPEQNAIDLFAETSDWAKRMGRTITPDIADLVGWLTVSANRWAEQMEQPAASIVAATDIGTRVCRAVAELPDRSSPEDWPEAMLVTQDELLAIVVAEMQGAALVAPEQALTDEERTELDRLRTLVNTPMLHSFRDGVVLEAVHQRERWGSAQDAGKAPADWFWLVGYLAGKALHAQTSGNTEKALTHTITPAAALSNWHAAIAGDHTAMRPGIDPAEHGITKEGGVAC